MKDENGKWQLAFWIMSGMCILGIMALSNAVIDNDRVRSQEDYKLSDKIEMLMKETMSSNAVIMADLREIKTRMGIRKEL